MSGLHERVVENWLTNVNELNLQGVFCQLLTGEGFQVVHISRHGAFEEGKDIIAINPVGEPCAFQLKSPSSSGKITNKHWERECRDQVIRLVELPIKHPSINPTLPRNIYFVTNGDLDEEVRLEIDGRNQEWERRGYPKLQTVVKGQLLTRFLRLQSNLWPSELQFEKNLLELYLADGTDNLQKSKLADFLYQLLPLSNPDPNKNECKRALASAAITTSYVLSSYVHKNNHVAIFEGWMLYIAYLTALVEKNKLEEIYWYSSFRIAIYAVYDSLEKLCAELQQRKDLTEGHILVDAPFYHARVTWLISLAAAFALWHKSQNVAWAMEQWSYKFVEKYKSEMRLWGEAAVSQFLAFFWFRRMKSASINELGILISLIRDICKVNLSKKIELPPPYVSFAEVVRKQLGISELSYRENFWGASYTLELLVYLIARRGLRQYINLFWPEITKMAFFSFIPHSAWQFCLWRTDKDGGLNQDVQPKMPQSWAELQKIARGKDISLIPQIFQEHPELLLMFVLVFPHRLTSDIAKYLDDAFHEIKIGKTNRKILF